MGLEEQVRKRARLVTVGRGKGKFSFAVMTEMDQGERGRERKELAARNFPKLSSCLKQSRNWKGRMEEGLGTIC